MKSLKPLTICLICIYVITLIPLFVLGYYNWPSADDFSMALQPHQTFVATGSVLATVQAAFEKTIYLYNNWIGYFFSSLLTTLSPSIFNERLSVLTPYIIISVLTLGTFVFFHGLLVTFAGSSREHANIVSVLTLLLIIQSMKGSSRVESFYWYSGAINYMFMYGLALLYLGLMLGFVFGGKKSYLRLFFISLLAFLLGGCNYMTALSLAIISALILVLPILLKFGIVRLDDKEKETRAKLLMIPAVLNLAGLVVSAVAPGNAIRSSANSGMGPVTAIITSLTSTITVCFGELFRWEVVAVLVIIAVLTWNLAPSFKVRFSYPVIFVIFAYGMVSANMTPPYFATGNIGAERIYSLIWAQFITFSVLTTIYISAWLRQKRLATSKDSASSNAGVLISRMSAMILAGTIALTAIFSFASMIKDHHYFSASSAAYDIIKGKALIYLDENIDRLKVLQDDSQKDVVLDRHTERPELLFHEDIYPDSNEWINTVVAKYYNKNTVAQRDD